MMEKQLGYERTRDKIAYCCETLDCSKDEHDKFLGLLDKLTLNNSINIYYQVEQLENEINEKRNIYESTKKYIEDNIDNPDFSVKMRLKMMKYHLNLTLENAKDIHDKLYDLKYGMYKYYFLIGLIMACFGWLLMFMIGVCKSDKIVMMGCVWVGEYLMDVALVSLMLGGIVMIFNMCFLDITF